MANLTVFALLALFAFQGLEAKSYQHEENVRDIIDNIKALIAKIEDFIKNLDTEIPAIIDELKAKIKEIFEQMHIKDLVKKIEDKVAEMLANAGIDINAAKQCIMNEKPAVQKLIEDTKAEATACQEAAMKQTQELTDSVKAVIDEVNSIRADVEGRVTKCQEDNKDNKAKVVACLVQQIGAVVEEVQKLSKDIQHTIQVAQEVSQKVQDSMTKCMATVQTHLQDGEKQIVDDIKKCIFATSTVAPAPTA